MRCGDGGPQEAGMGSLARGRDLHGGGQARGCVGPAIKGGKNLFFATAKVPTVIKLEGKGVKASMANPLKTRTFFWLPFTSQIYCE